MNPVQGKHVPVSPSLPLLLFSALAAKIESRYPEERLLVIGFAETATAIGSTIAYKAKNAVYYMNTTRESVAGAAYLFFTESHSHATEQRLVANGMGDILSNVDRVIFAEDEVTTGSTIEKLIRILQGKYADKALKFGIISILNSMPDARLRELEGEGIPCDCLYRLPVRYRVDEVERHTYLPLSTEKAKGTCGQVRTVRVGGYWNCRQAADTAKIRRLTENLWTRRYRLWKRSGRTAFSFWEQRNSCFPVCSLGRRLKIAGRKNGSISCHNTESDRNIKG